MTYEGVVKRVLHDLLINTILFLSWISTSEVRYISNPFMVHFWDFYQTVADLPCTESLYWVCCECQGHAWAAPGSSCPSSCLSVRRAAAGKWQDCRAEEPTLDTRSAGTRCLHNKRHPEANTVNHKQFELLKTVVVNSQESLQVH